jgi:hypothetical protein
VLSVKARGTDTNQCVLKCQTFIWNILIQETYDTLKYLFIKHYSLPGSAAVSLGEGFLTFQSITASSSSGPSNLVLDCFTHEYEDSIIVWNVRNTHPTTKRNIPPDLKPQLQDCETPKPHRYTTTYKFLYCSSSNWPRCLIRINR